LLLPQFCLSSKYKTKQSLSYHCLALGLHHSIGLLARRDEIAPDDAEVVKRMRRAGAIPFVLTNIPEFCMWYESRCNVYGQTNNPYDTNRMVGGSSGGEVNKSFFFYYLLFTKANILVLSQVSLLPVDRLLESELMLVVQFVCRLTFVEFLATNHRAVWWT
jgi:Amidase